MLVIIFKVIHGVEYKNAETGACTNTIEEKLNGLKYHVHPKSRATGLDEYLQAKIWFSRNYSDLCAGLINVLHTIQYIKTAEVEVVSIDGNDEADAVASKIDIAKKQLEDLQRQFKADKK